jgi:hypothetical protein
VLVLLFHKAQSVASCKVKVKEASLLSVQKNMIKCILFQKVDGVPVLTKQSTVRQFMQLTELVTVDVVVVLPYVQR